MTLNPYQFVKTLAWIFTAIFWFWWWMGCAAEKPVDGEAPKMVALLKVGFFETDSTGSDHSQATVHAIRQALLARPKLRVLDDTSPLPAEPAPMESIHRPLDGKGGGRHHGMGGEGGGRGGHQGGFEGHGEEKSSPSTHPKPLVLLVVGKILAWDPLATSLSDSGSPARHGVTLQVRLVSQATGRALWSDTLHCGDVVLRSKAVPDSARGSDCLARLSDQLANRISQQVVGPEGFGSRHQKP